VAKIDQMEFFDIFAKSHFLNVNGSKTVWDVFHNQKNVKIAEKVRKSVNVCQLQPIFYEFKSHFLGITPSPIIAPKTSYSSMLSVIFGMATLAYYCRHLYLHLKLDYQWMYVLWSE
jgi:hypothetical protein